VSAVAATAPRGPRGRSAPGRRAAGRSGRWRWRAGLHRGVAGARAQGARGRAGERRPEDRDRDGRPDRWVERDAAGRLSRVRDDRDRDGFPERTEIYVDGRLNRIGLRLRPRQALRQHRPGGADGRGGDDHDRPQLEHLPERWVQFNARAPDRVGVARRGRGLDARALPLVRRAGGSPRRASTPTATGSTRSTAPTTPAGPRARRRCASSATTTATASTSGARPTPSEGRLRTVNDDSDGDGVRDRITVFDRADGESWPVKEGRTATATASSRSGASRSPAGPRASATTTTRTTTSTAGRRPAPPAGWCAARCGGGGSGGITSTG
jgi:hypothetical protein